MTFIYALADPETDEIRYVGKADDVNQRFWAHLREAKSGKQSHKCNWIRKLLANDDQPMVCVLEQVDAMEWQKAEIYYIKQFKDMGANLTNLADGGEGFVSGYKQDILFKMKKILGNKLNELKRKKDYARYSRLAILLAAFAEIRPDLAPKRWATIQLP